MTSGSLADYLRHLTNCHCGSGIELIQLIIEVSSTPTSRDPIAGLAAANFAGLMQAIF